MINKLLNLEKKIGIKFQNKKNLIKSLTHKSFDSQNNNEKLEFLGDRVLGLVISSLIFLKFKDFNEGNLTKKLSYLVQKAIYYLDSLHTQKHLFPSKSQ